MQLDEIKISQAIIQRYTDKLLDSLDTDVAIVGGGPAGLTAAYYLAKEGRSVSVYERNLAIGGGMWGGGMMFNEIVVQPEAREILDEFGIRSRPFEEGYYSADSVETVSTLCSRAVQAGAYVFNLIGVEDVVIKDDRVSGLVINWGAVEKAHLHVDPLTVRARYVVDATGHDAEVASVIERKSGTKLDTPAGKVIGERPMWADEGERLTVEHTQEFYPGVFAAGMSANAVFGAPRMGPIFGGMILSGKKVAQLILERLVETNGLPAR